MRRTVFSSSTLLTEIMQRPLDPGYAAAHRRRLAQQDQADVGPAVGGPVRAGRLARLRGLVGRHTAAVTVLGLALGAAVGAGVAELRSTPLGTQDRAVLEAEIERRTGVADSVADTNAALREQIEQQQAAALAEGSQSVLAAADRLAVPVGAVAVVGDGVVVELDDAPDVRTEGGVGDDGRVRDGDVQTVVNALWGAGAEAVAVNGQRLTALSTIRHAGDAIVVDLRQLARPYVIEAVGDQEAMLEELTRGRVADYTRFLRTNYGISVAQGAQGDLRLPAASRVSLRHASEVVPVRPDGAVQEDGES